MPTREFSRGENPVMTGGGNGIVAMFGGADSHDLARRIFPVIDLAEAGDDLVDAILAAEGLDADFAVVQVVGPVLRAHLRGGSIALKVVRLDGTVAVFAPPPAPRWSTIVEPGCASVEIFDVAATSDETLVPVDAPAFGASRIVLTSGPSAPLVPSDRHPSVAGAAELLEPTVIERTAPRVTTIEFANGSTIRLDSTVLIGRSPRVERASSPSMPVLVPVPSAGSAVSRTHLKISVDGSRVVLEDLNSTNGTTITPTSGQALRLQPGEPALLSDGTVVAIGENIAFRVVELP